VTYEKNKKGNNKEKKLQALERFHASRAAGRYRDYWNFGGGCFIKLGKPEKKSSPIKRFGNREERIACHGGLLYAGECQVCERRYLSNL
jgi:hypothetical protein